MNVHISWHLKEGLTWVIDKWPWVISTVMLLKTVYTTKKLKNIAIVNLKQYYMHCCVTISNVF